MRLSTPPVSSRPSICCARIAGPPERDLVAALREVIPSAQFEEVNPSGPVHRAPERFQPYDLSYARDALGYEPRYDLRSAIQEYVREVQGVAGVG